MHVTFQPFDVTCLTPMKSDRDAVQLFFGVASDTGSADRFESSIDSIVNDLNPGPFDLKAGQQVDLSENLPVGRASWRTNPIEISENGRVRFSLTGIGLHKAELGGGADPDSTLGKFMGEFRHAFIDLIPKIGGAINALIDLAETVANADPDKNCLGPLFTFEKEYIGSDLIFSLLQSSRVNAITFQPGDSVRVNVSDKCRRPQYAAYLKIYLDRALDFETDSRSVGKGRGPDIRITEFWHTCKRSDLVLAWVARSENIYHFAPKLPFTVLRYVWSVNGTELSQSETNLSVSVSVLRLDQNSPTSSPTRKNESVVIRFDVDAAGRLTIYCSENSGNFELDVSCDLQHNGDKIRVYSKKVNVESEAVDGNAAYKDYLECVRSYWLGFKRKVDIFTEHLRTIPAEVPRFDTFKQLESWDKVMSGTSKLITQVEKISPSLSKKPHR